jgi:hypothetical protein
MTNWIAREWHHLLWHHLFGTGVLLVGLCPMTAGASVPVETLPPGGGTVTQWTLVGPFPNARLDTPAADGSGRAGWNVDYLSLVGGEGEAVLEPGVVIAAPVDGEQIKVRTRAVRANPRGLVDMLGGLEMDDEDGAGKIAYGFARVEVTTPGPHKIMLGADDSAKLFLDGEEIFAEWTIGQGVTPGQYQLDVELSAGTHDLLIKLDNNSGPWGFILDMSHTDELERYRQMEARGPEDFPKFEFAGHDNHARALEEYTWHFFDKRMGNFETLFVREYMTIADVWLANAIERNTGKPIQDLIRGWWDKTTVDADGYVQSHQHFSSSHDGGWPFPLWPQMVGGHVGHTWGWHFQEANGKGWIWEFGMVQKDTPYTGTMAANSWRLDGAESRGIEDGLWHVQLLEPDATLTTPVQMRIHAHTTPFLQVRWKRNPAASALETPYIEWKREGDTDWSAERRMLIHDYDSSFAAKGMRHSIIPLYRHPLWEGPITEFRLVLAPGGRDVDVRIDSVFSVFDTRKPYNNLLFITGAWEYFRWTGDVAFLERHINRMRMALRFAQESLHTREMGHVRNTWSGHDGIAGWYRDEKGKQVGRPGHGIGNNYYDLLPFGWDDMYNTSQYYGAVLAMANLEELIAKNPGWALPEGGLAFDAEELRTHAARVKEVSNEKFWNDEAGRFYGSIDRDGTPHDYGFTFVQLEAIWYGLANDHHAREAMDWISGRRIVGGDTSTGEDIYVFRFGPRATTLRNIEWYGQGWTGPESLEFGQQIQDGGAVLGMTFYDLYARLQVYGPDDAWNRLKAILEWDQEVRAEGGYREYYRRRGVTLQGGGTAGGIGVDFEFLESSLPPAIIPYGFMGLDPRGDHLRITPRLPSAVPSMTARNVLYQGVRMDVTASMDGVTLVLHDQPVHPLRIVVSEPHRLEGNEGTEFELSVAGTHQLTRVDRSR